MNSPRKFVSIRYSAPTDISLAAYVAIADDGTAWEMLYNEGQNKWNQIPPLPLRKEPGPYAALKDAASVMSEAEWNRRKDAEQGVSGMAPKPRDGS